MNVPYHHPEDPVLGIWVSEQRRLYDQLSQKRIDKLESLGFNFSVVDDDAKTSSFRERSIRESSATLEERWHMNYKHLQEFHRVHGNCIVSRNHDKPLSYWVVRQRQLNLQQKLKPDRKALLEKLGFEWYVGGTERPEHHFDEMMGRLSEYQQEFGSVDVPGNFSRGGLGGWLESLKGDATEGKLSPERAERLLRAGITWSEDRSSWLKTLEKVSQETRALRRNSTGVLELPKTVENWLKIQFLLLDYDLLPPKRRSRFEALGLTWNGTELSWVEYGPGEPMVGNAWLVDELASGVDLKDAAMSWTPTANGKNLVRAPAVVVQNDDDSSHSETPPPKSIVGDAESPASSFDGGHSETGTSPSPIIVNDASKREESTGKAMVDSRIGSDNSVGSSAQYESALESAAEEEEEEEPVAKKPRVASTGT